MNLRRVHYRCNRGGHESFVDMPSDAPPRDRRCSCGARATWFRIEPAPLDDEPANEAPYAFVKGRPYEFDRQFEVQPQGRHYGVSDEAHNEAHRRRDQQFADEHHRFRRGHSKRKTENVQFLGSMPAEMVHQIGMQERDPAAVTKDPVAFLRKTGRLASS